MKTGSKIMIALVSFGWLCVAFFLVLFLCREMDWALATGEWFTNAWNTIFQSDHGVAGFYNRLGDLLFWFSVGYAVFTMVFVICCVKINSDDGDTEEETEKEETEVKKVEKKEAKAKKSKKLSLKKSAEKVETTVEATEKLVDSHQKSINDFLNTLKNK